ncbi:MAG: RimK/LysX family protein [Pseudomonadota bacterium]
MKNESNVESAGWREWVSLPDLPIGPVKAKLDTGARSSALNAWNLQALEIDGVACVSFDVFRTHKDTTDIVRCTAPIIDQRAVKSSTGDRTQRFVIETTLQMGAHRWPIEMTLIDRRNMLFRMLVGRTALSNRFTVDPSSSYRVGAKPTGKGMSQ